MLVPSRALELWDWRERSGVGAPRGTRRRTRIRAGAATPLSQRQWEVARLVADGLSHREIAERLFISRRTVEVHVAHIRRKLGFSSQARIVAWILQHDRSPCEQGEGEGMRALPLSGEPLDDGRGRTR